MTKVTWKGQNGDPDEISQYGITFPRGKAVEVDPEHPQMDKFRGNAAFAVEGDDSAAPLRLDGPTEAEYRRAGYTGTYPPKGYAVRAAAAPPSKPTASPAAYTVLGAGDQWLVLGPLGFEPLGPMSEADALVKAASLNAAG